MSIQWTIIASFLYVEIAVLIILLLPFISPARWQKLFKSRFLRTLEAQANIYFSVFIAILVLFFIDAIRDMRKYSVDDQAHSDHSHLSAELQAHMKLFRAQRNFFISGFAVFLWLVLRRLVTLISSQATLMASTDAAMKQAQSATDAAQKLLDEAAKRSATAGYSADNEGNSAREKTEYEKEIIELKKTLEESKDELKRTKVDFEAMKRQSESLAVEYDRLCVEHTKLQRIADNAQGGEAEKKDD